MKCDVDNAVRLPMCERISKVLWNKTVFVHNMLENLKFEVRIILLEVRKIVFNPTLIILDGSAIKPSMMKQYWYR